MESTPIPSASASIADAPVPLAAVTPAGLLAAFAGLPDPRRASRVVYPVAALLALALAALLSGQVPVLAMVQWGARQVPSLLVRLGFRDGCHPCQSTL